MHIRLSCNPHSMKGFLLCLIVIVAVVAVRSQGPPTRTKKGKRPPRRNDNPDVGLPSGADIPDGRYQVVNSHVNVPPRGGGAPPPPSNNGPPIGGPPKGGPIKGGPPKGGPPKGGPIKGGPPKGGPPKGGPIKGGPPKGGPIKGGPPTPPKVVPPKWGPRPGKYGPPSGGPPARPPVRPPMSGPPKVLPPGKYGPPKLPPAGKYGPPKSGVKKSGGHRNDNPDRGLPSGRDFPDNRRTKTRSGPPPPKRRPYGGVKPINYVPPVPKWYAPVVPAVPAVPAAPAHSCDYYCQFEGYKPVCTIYGNEYDNDCYRACRNEPRDCENQCPCDSNANPVDQTGPIVPAVPWGGRCDHCYNNEHSPVCVDGEETMYNECFANCEGKAPTCTSACPCT